MRVDLLVARDIVYLRIEKNLLACLTLKYRSKVFFLTNWKGSEAPTGNISLKLAQSYKSRGQSGRGFHNLQDLPK